MEGAPEGTPSFIFVYFLYFSLKHFIVFSVYYISLNF